MFCVFGCTCCYREGSWGSKVPEGGGKLMNSGEHYQQIFVQPFIALFKLSISPARRLVWQMRGQK
jgi:hypothetical protein